MSMPSEPRVVKFSVSVRLRVGPGRGFLFDERSGRVYSLNASGALAAAYIDAGRSTPDVVTAVVEAFDIDAETARRDLARFVAQLLEEGLASTREDVVG